MSLALQDAPGWGAGSSSVDHQTVSVSRESCTDFRISELQVKTGRIIAGVYSIFTDFLWSIFFSYNKLVSINSCWFEVRLFSSHGQSKISGLLNLPSMAWLSLCVSFRIDKSLLSCFAPFPMNISSSSRTIFLQASLGAQTVKNPPAMQETWVPPLGGEEPLEKGMATYSSILAWRIPWTEQPGGLQSLGSQRVGYD